MPEHVGSSGMGGIGAGRRPSNTRPESALSGIESIPGVIDEWRRGTMIPGGNREAPGNTMSGFSAARRSAN